MAETTPAASSTSSLDAKQLEQLQEINKNVAAIKDSMQQTASSMNSMGEAIEGMNTMQWAQGFGSAAAATLQAIGAVVCASLQKKTLNHQKQAAKAQYTHQSDMARIDKETKLYKLEKDQELLNCQVEGQKKYLSAVRDVKRAEGQLAIVEAKIKDQKLTDEVGKVDKDALKKAFAGYYNGNPVYS